MDEETFMGNGFFAFNTYDTHDTGFYLHESFTTAQFDRVASHIMRILCAVYLYSGSDFRSAFFFVGF
jgi:hypothetical protein